MSRKSVNIISPNYVPEITASAHRIEAAAKALSYSYKVNVFTLAEMGTSKVNYSMKCDENLIIHYLSLPNYRKSVFIIRAFYEIWYSIKLIRKSNSVKADLAIVSIPFMFLLPLFAKFSNARKKIADIRDIVWHYLPETNFLKRFIKRSLINIMHASLNKYDLIIVTNEAERKWLKVNAGLNDLVLNVIPNGVSSDKFRQLSDVKYSPHPQKFTITYIGNIGTSQQFHSLIDTVKEIKDIRLNLIGDGNDYKTLKQYVLSQKITNVFLPGKLRWIRTIPYYQTSNLLFASLKEDFNTAIPSKLYEYLSTGLPILYYGDGAAADFLRNYKNTFIVTSGNSNDIEKAIWKIKKLELIKAKKNIENIGSTFIREKLSLRFVELSARLLNETTLSNLYVEDILQDIEQ